MPPLKRRVVQSKSPKLKIFHFLLANTALSALATSAAANETITYTYDAKGRLTQVSHSGTVNNGVQTSYGHDRADNRSSVIATSGGTPPPSPPPPSPPSPPPPPSPPTNSPPVTKPDSGGLIAKCATKTVNVTANDTDPEGNYPLSVVGAIADGGLSVTVVSSTSVEIESLGPSGTKTVTYTVRDSLGATATGIISLVVRTTGSCAL